MSEHFLSLPYDFVPGGAIFDCDGTLADTMPLHFVAWTETLQPFGCPFPEDTFYEWGGVTTHEIVERLNAKFGHTLVPDDISVAKEAAYTRLIPQVTAVEAIVAEMHRLHGKCPVAVASGGTRDVVLQTLDSLKLLPYFDTVVTANDVARGKPEPDTFLLAAERLGVAPKDCVVYEDTPTGFEAARRAGMRVVDVRPHYAVKEKSRG